MKMTLIPVILAGAFGSVYATAMGDLAATMNSGEWRQFTTANIQSVLQETDPDGASGGILGYAEGGGWNPTDEEFLFIGGDHFYGGGGYPKFAVYSARANAWRQEPRPSWFPFNSSGAMHGYDHNTIDAAGGFFYHHPACCNPRIQKYNLSTRTWMTALPALPYYAGYVGVAYYPELKGIVVASPSVYFFPDNGTRWVTLASGLTMGGYHHFAEYNPVHKVVVFGGGNDPGANKIYRLDSARKITPLKDAPVNLGVHHGGIFTVDPVSGDYLFFHSSGSFYVYDVTTDTWQLQPGNNFFSPILGESYGNYKTWEVVAAPVSSYGVVMFAKSNGSSSMVYLYKHNGTAVERAQRPGLASPLRIAPNPFSRSARISFPGKAVLEIFDLSGRRIARTEHSGEETVFTPPRSACGVFIVKLHDGKSVFSRKMMYSR